MTWLLEGVSIEGFRGVNNEGAPLELKFHAEKVNSVFAPNGVGKSSIFEAVTYALTGEIPKLKRLQAVERPGDYYLNRFHSGNVGTIGLTLRPAGGGGGWTVRHHHSAA
jgi:recombinational DNA repair ATPase RecF